jgi:DNA-binding GntR family transcriptional regulator
VRREESLRDHRAIVAALRRRDSAEAERIGRAHVASTRVDLRRTLAEPDGLAVPR